VVGLGPQPFARQPNPINGSMIDQTRVTASWYAGTFAALHDVYFGESYERVSVATPNDADVYVGRQAVTQLLIGASGGLMPTGLVPGKTYYWRVDEINGSNPASPGRATSGASGFGRKPLGDLTRPMEPNTSFRIRR